MSIRFGVSPIAWVNDDMPELGGDTPLETILADACDIGFAGIELGGKFPRDPATLKPLLAGYGLDLVGGWFSGALLAHDVEAEIAAAEEAQREAKRKARAELRKARHDKRHEEAHAKVQELKAKLHPDRKAAAHSA